MQIVIDIDEDLYKSIICHRCKSIFQQRCDYEDLKNAIEDGVTLPKGHGRLKDVDWIDDNCENHYSDKDGSWCYIWRDIDKAPTIIEADRSEEKE